MDLDFSFKLNEVGLVSQILFVAEIFGFSPVIQFELFWLVLGYEFKYNE